MPKEKEKDYDGYELKAIYENMEMELVYSFYRNLTKHKKDEIQAGFSWEMWQVAALRNIENYRKENQQIIGEHRSEVKESINKVLEQAYNKGKQNVEQMAKQAQIKLDKGSIVLPEHQKNTGEVNQIPPQENNFFAVNKRKLDAMIKTVQDDMVHADQAIHRKMDDEYRQTIYNAKIQLANGAISLDKAIDIATESFLSKGINCIAYKDKDGSILRYVNIATYAEMALRTAQHRARLLGEGAKRDEMGRYLIFVSSHGNCCKLCYPWQGQVLIDDVYAHPSKKYLNKYKGKYKLLSEAIKAGLLHPNCRHTLATYFEGITRLPQIHDKQEALANYENEQKQRQLENKIRQAKRKLAGCVDDENRTQAKRYVLKCQKELRDFLKDHPEFKRHPHREKVYSNQSVKLGRGESKSLDGDIDGEYVEQINMDEVDKYIEKYENEIKNAKIEHAYVIHEDGKVMHYTGTEKGVNIPPENLRNAIITHNHPIIEDVPSNGFQKDDFSFLQGHGLEIKRLRATYGDIRYEVKALKDLSRLSFSEYRIRGSAMIDITADYIDMDENAYLLLAKEGYIEYTKTKTEVK